MLFQRPAAKFVRPSRSRNVTDSTFSKGNAAGQSTVSYFNTKNNTTSSTN